jgi:hypothetical protein
LAVPQGLCIVELAKNAEAKRMNEIDKLSRIGARSGWQNENDQKRQKKPYKFEFTGQKEKFESYFQLVKEEDPATETNPVGNTDKAFVDFVNSTTASLSNYGEGDPLQVISERNWFADQLRTEAGKFIWGDDTIANSHILLLVNYRPEYSHAWGNKSYYSQLRLDALGHEGAQEMLATLLGEGVELDPIKRMVIERTEGNPFFIEEMVQTLFDEGALMRNGVVRVTRSLSQLHLPATVQGILSARIDRLSVGQKDLLQTLAVMGRESPLTLIRQMASPSGGGLEQMLSVLQAGEFIYEQPAAAEIDYTFKHALTQEVAYNSLLIERRKLLHERAAGSMESLYAERLDDHLGELAHHYERSGNTGKALEYLRRAGEQAAQRSAHAEAIELFSAALRLLKTLPETPERIQRELALQLGLGVSFMIIKQWSAPEVAQLYSRARELCRLLGDPPQLLPVLFGLPSAILGASGHCGRST